MELSDKQVDSAAILMVTGRIDMATSDAFRERVLAMLAGGLGVFLIGHFCSLKRHERRDEHNVIELFVPRMRPATPASPT